MRNAANVPAGSSTNPSPECRLGCRRGHRRRLPFSALPDWLGVGLQCRQGEAHDLLLAQVDYLPPEHPSQQPSVVGAIAALASRRPTSLNFAGLALTPS